MTSVRSLLWKKWNRKSDVCKNKILHLFYDLCLRDYITQACKNMADFGNVFSATKSQVFRVYYVYFQGLKIYFLFWFTIQDNVEEVEQLGSTFRTSNHSYFQIKICIN